MRSSCSVVRFTCERIEKCQASLAVVLCQAEILYVPSVSPARQGAHGSADRGTNGLKRLRALRALGFSGARLDVQLMIVLKLSLPRSFLLVPCSSKPYQCFKRDSILSWVGGMFLGFDSVKECTDHGIGSMVEPGLGRSSFKGHRNSRAVWALMQASMSSSYVK